MKFLFKQVSTGISNLFLSLCTYPFPTSYFIGIILTGSQHRPLSRRIYSELNEKIEQISKLLPYFVKLSVAGIALLSSFLTAFNYFVYDLGNDSYYLPCQIMYVLECC